ANLDVRSMRLNFELNVFIRDPRTAADLERVLRRDFEEGSQQIVLEKFMRRSGWQRFKESLVRPLAPLI
ncbi:MAG: cardiolipin synthase, partial [Chthoniobacterales bacterium]